jgi:uncharacterized protein (TIGR00369 family)
MAEPNQIFDLIRASIGQIPFNALLGIELAEIENDRARVTLPWKPELGRSTGAVHGGVTATLLDVVGAAAVASNLGVSSSKTFATISLLVNYLDSAEGEDLSAEAKIIRRTSSHAFVEARVSTAAGRLLATGSMVYKT